MSPPLKILPLGICKNVALTHLVCVIYMCNIAHSPTPCLPHLPHFLYIPELSSCARLCTAWNHEWGKLHDTCLSQYLSTELSWIPHHHGISENWDKEEIQWVFRGIRTGFIKHFQENRYRMSSSSQEPGGQSNNAFWERIISCLESYTQTTKKKNWKKIKHFHTRIVFLKGSGGLPWWCSS